MRKGSTEGRKIYQKPSIWVLRRLVQIAILDALHILINASAIDARCIEEGVSTL